MQGYIITTRIIWICHFSYLLLLSLYFSALCQYTTTVNALCIIVVEAVNRCIIKKNQNEHLIIFMQNHSMKERLKISSYIFKTFFCPETQSSAVCYWTLDIWYFYTLYYILHSVGGFPLYILVHLYYLKWSSRQYIYIVTCTSLTWCLIGVEAAVLLLETMKTTAPVDLAVSPDWFGGRLELS